MSLKLSDTRVYEPQIRARLGTTARFCEVVVRGAQAMCKQSVGGALYIMDPIRDSEVAFVKSQPVLPATFFFFTLVTGPKSSLSLKLSDTRVYEPQIRARLGTTAHFCRVVGNESVVVAETYINPGAHAPVTPYTERVLY